MKYHIEFDLELRTNPYKGTYIALEGIDGSGKTTQSELLQNYFKEKDISFILTSEPRREGVVGTLIHDILRGKVSVPSISLQYLYTADRIVNHEEIVDLALKEGKTVISHRSLWSNLPYGMVDKEVVDYDSNDARVIDVAHGLMSLYNQFIIPDITFYLRVNPEVAMERITKMRKVIELYEKREKIEKIARGYEWQVKKFPEEFVVIDGDREPEEITKDLIKVIENYKK